MKCPLSSRCEREHQRCGDRALFGTTDCEGCVGPVADLDGCEHELAAVEIGDINRPAVAYPIARNDVASFADEVELAPRLELRPRRRVAFYLREGVERAPLDPGARPGLAHGLGEPAPAVGDDHVGRRDRRHEGRSRPRVLRPCHVPGDHPLAAAAYEHHELARDPDPVDVEHAVELAAGDGHRPDLPELGRPAPEGPPAARHHGLRVLREEPPEELLEPRRRVVVPQRRRGAAGRAPPALGPR